MKVLMIGPYPRVPGMVRGGVEAVIATIAPAIAEHEAIERLVVVSFYQESQVGAPRPLMEAAQGKLTVVQLPAQRRLAAPSFALFDWLRTRRITSSLRPDVIHAQGVGTAGFIGTHVGVPAVVTVHGNVPLEFRMWAQTKLGRARARFADYRAKSALRHAEVVISISDYDAQQFKSSTRGRMVAIPNPIPDEFFADTITAGQGVLFAGMLLPRKNIAGLLRAVHRLKQARPDILLTIIGPTADQAYAEYLHTLTEELDLSNNVRLLGHVPSDVLVRELRSCAVVALFSEEETSPTIIAQAMAAGKPVVASAVGGIPELVEDGLTGWLVPPRDEVTLAGRLEALLANPRLQVEMGKRGRLATKARTVESVARRTVDVYRSVVEPGHQRHAAVRRALRI